MKRFIDYFNPLAVIAIACGFACSESPTRTPTPDPISVPSVVPLTPPPAPTPAPPFVPPAPVPPPNVAFSIEGVESITSGMLSLTISGVTTTATTTGPVPAISWAVYPSEDIRIERNGHVVYYAAVEPKHVWFVAACNHTDPSAAPWVAMKLVTIGSPKPVPPAPTPDDDKKPKPVPAGTLSAWVTSNIGLVNLPAADRKASAAKLATEFSRVAGETWVTPDEIVERMEAVSRIAVSPHEVEWQPFFDAMGDELGRRAEAGTLKTLADHVQMLRDLSTGLKGVK